MLSRPVARCPLWQRPLRTTSDSIWVAEDATAEAFQQLSFRINFQRRSASSVPGPMESRRRVGKRRLGSLPEVARAPIQDIGAIWDFLKDDGKYQWQWEAPSKLQERTAHTARLQLPAWLSDFKPLPQETQVTTLKEEQPSPLFQPAPSIVVETDVRQFLNAVKDGLPHEIPTLCGSFNYRYKHHIMLGLVSEGDLSANLRDIIAVMRELPTDEATATSRCYSLCLAMWEGIKASKVLRPSDLGSGVIDELLISLGDLPSLSSVQILATDIVKMSPKCQIGDMKQGALGVTKAWLSNWRHLASIDANGHGRELISEESIPNTGAFQSLNDSVKGLTKFLGLLPEHMAHNLVVTISDHIVSASFRGSISTFRKIRFSWMSVVANTPCVNEELLVRTWLTMNLLQSRLEGCDTATPTIYRLQLHESCKLLLDFWISHGHLTAPDDVRATFYASITRSSRADDVGHLLQAIIKHGEDFEATMRSLLSVIRRVGKPRAIHDIFKVLQRVGIGVPVSLLKLEIEEMSRIDVQWAWSIYKLSHKISHGTPLSLEKFPELVIAIIKCPDIHPDQVWQALDMRPGDRQWLSSSSRMLASKRASLVHNMALAFAHTDFLSPRVAFRNVSLCIRYLRRHQIPLKPILSRAITHSGLTRDLLRQRWITTARVRYILDAVKQVEGRDVSLRMDLALYAWQSEFHKRQKQANRAANLLRPSASSWS